ncbi:unnamed protein product [Ceutorhynchus assimilis]|uniref:S1 motif domain-containing protein n=1 Tax=Ceutorhynchus assimilis TaxID=467358 RepID=A0A9N9MX19_9CUCU|nr:unnamed protein product [Ceutorhynchus assimilis]
MTEEESFPRGGSVVRKRPPQENETLFSIAKPPKAKKSKKSKPLETAQTSDDIFQSVINIKGSLSYNKIQTGMVILGCIRNVSTFALEIELPGLCFATVPITSISDPFTKHLNKQLENDEPETTTILSKMFSIGQHIPAKIINIESKDSGTKVEATMNPREIYSTYNHNLFKKGSLVWGSINIAGDHGFEIDLGVKNTRAFLPLKNLQPDQDYSIGKPIWCVVHKFDNTATASTVRLSAKTEHLLKQETVDNLHLLIPSMKVEFYMDKIKPHGILGKISDNNFIGYVDENYLNKPLANYQEGRLISAYILYVEPTTDIVHLTLRLPLVQQTKPLDVNVGDILTAQVSKKLYNGLLFALLPTKLKAFVTNRRLLNTINKKDPKITEVLGQKYPITSKHQVRIIDYNHLSQLFICTPEQNVIKETVFAAQDLTPGQLCDVIVEDIKEEGIVVATGHIKGFVTNLHLSNNRYTANVKKKFKEGQKIKARVLSVTDQKVHFTLKPALLENDDCLTKMEDAQIGKKYIGVVSKVSDSGALVVFYDNVKGWISQKGMGKESTDPQKYFFVGQVVNIYVWRLEPTHMYLSLFQPQIKTSLPNIGGRYCGIVKSTNERGVNVQIENTKRRGFIPNAHLSCSINLCLSVKNALSVGDRVQDLMYVGGMKPQLFSRREALAMKSKRVNSLKNLDEGQIIRCFYQSTTDEGIYVVPLIYDFSEPVFINKKEINFKDFVEHQLLLARIKKLDLVNKQIILSIKPKEVFDGKVETTINLFTEYLNELTFLYQQAKKHKSTFVDFNPGDQVTCKIEKLGLQGGCVATLPNGAQAIAVPSLCPKTIKVGDLVIGTVLGHDYEKNFVDICLKTDICGRINPTQDGALTEVLPSGLAKKLLEKDGCVIALLNHPSGNKQLIYLPTRLHQNDLFDSCLEYYKEKKLKVCVCGRMKKFLIGMSKKLFLEMDKVANKKSKVDIVPHVVETKKKHEVEITQKKKTIEIEEMDSDSGIEPEEENNMEIASNHSITLPGISSFFSIPKVDAETQDTSSSEDEDDTPKEKKKKKLSPTERAELLRQEEERLTKIEKELADASRAPESADQFDRLLLAKPDSAELWAKYVALHIAATEIDKARAVAKKALDTINMTLTDEKFKIWIVLLNLENLFGTKESFDKTLEDALKFNDSLKVYLKAIEMLAENAKYSEMEEKIDKARVKHKQNATMWLEIGKTYYQIGKYKEARNCKDRALKSILDKKTQMNIIVRFAILEFKHGEPDQGSAIFETILTSDPKKINIWSTYVDQLVKKERLDEARQVLERAVCQRLPLKSMKSLFMKFRKFEEVHGTPASVDGVKQRAQEYVNKFEKRH